MFGMDWGGCQGVYSSRVFDIVLFNIGVRIQDKTGCRELTLMSPIVLANSATLV